MIFVYIILLISLTFSFSYLLGNGWEILIGCTEQEEVEEIYNVYRDLKDHKIACKLKNMEQEIFLNSVVLNLLVRKRDLEKAKKLLKQRSKTHCL
ncbi:hypothetical protein H1D32_08025 [Anaerobacillus sp. CMMVII]|uniref:hypothetical protein n=1 Tax=Anaerobacillus sp. CMMVII TaxID=2755588 RepID=UPI0021B73511|nr:hypothetical protein [Anaerobacillus sp. CMMVII]MCT8137709.1 hypothetical protein [Anaerobacillus sp. CMMVII]